MSNSEKFDNICINSQDIDVDNKLKTNFNGDNANISNSFSHLYYKDHNNKTENDDSSNDSEEITFIRQISKPLLNTSYKKYKIKRKYLHRQKRFGKFIGVFFISTIIIGILLMLFFIFFPQNSLKYIIQETLNRYLFKNETLEIVGCDEILINDVWIKNFPKMLSEGAARLLKITNDDVLDIVLPFGTNVENQLICKIYYYGQKRCFGGLLALDGVTGQVIWRYDGNGEMYAVVCSEDLNSDGWIDCVGAGRKGTFAAVNGRNGTELWTFNKKKIRSKWMNLYTPQFIDDVDNDGVKDIVQIHGGDPLAEPTEMNRLIAKVIIFSGRTGKILISKNMPDNLESYYSPQILNLGDGLKKVLFGTGGETIPGNLFEMDLNLLINSNQKSETRKIYKGHRKGVMTPPVLVDLNSDGRPDIVLCPFADECLAIDGITFKEIWKFIDVKNSETYATPAAGYYNDDQVPDIFIQLFVGPGYPVYFYGETLILDGRNGKLLKKLTRSNNLVISSPLTLSMEGYGNDMFLHWIQLCRDHENDINTTPFQNLPQYMLSRAHLCKIRFNTSTNSLFLIHGRNLINKSLQYGQIYNSENYFHLQHEVVENNTEEIKRFLTENPEYRDVYQNFIRLSEGDLSKFDEGYASNQNNFHDYLLRKQQKLNDIDLNDSGVHDLIDFSKPSDEEIINLKDYDFKDESKRKFRDLNKHDEEKLFRFKRHNGPHDGEGLQRLIGTGTLVSPLLNDTDPNFAHSMDIVFFTYWSTPKEIVLQTPMEINCNSKWANIEWQRFNNDSKFFLYDHDHYTKYGNLYCARKYGSKVERSEIEKQSLIFNNHVGQLTVYRKRIKCTCSSGRLKMNQRCSRILPLRLQSWPAYLGLDGTAYWNSSALKFHKAV